MAISDASQLKVEIDEIVSRIDKIVKKVKPYYPETEHEEEVDNPEIDEQEG